MPQHVHRFKPRWVLLTSPAWCDGYHKIIAHAVCLLCGEETYVSAWQSPGHLRSLDATLNKPTRY